jgi:hypothetical protein
MQRLLIPSLLLVLALSPVVQAWVTPCVSSSLPSRQQSLASASASCKPSRASFVLSLSQWDEDPDEVQVEVQRTSFDKAGQALTEEDDQKRLDEQGDSDANPNVRM